MSKKPSCFSTKIPLHLKDRLKNDLEEQGFSLSKPAYTVFSASKKGVSCTLYESGALTVQGKEKDPFIEFYLEPEILQNFSYTHPTANVDKTARIGCDEAGKGDYFGPIVSASLYADEKGIEKLLSMGVRDSKTFSDVKIRKLAATIEKEFVHQIVLVMPEKYNALYAKFQNLNTLLGWMHATAIAKLHEKVGCSKVIIDKFANEHVMVNALKKTGLPDLQLEQKVRAESDVVVAGASILARAKFLQGLEKLGSTLAISLPKGASKAVIIAGKKLVSEHGKNVLSSLSKSHFKTNNLVLGIE